MSRNNIETVAERAARFEDIDFERYNRLKAKYGELDLSQQLENDFDNQLQLQRYLRLNSFGSNSATRGGGNNYIDLLEAKTVLSQNLNDYKLFEFPRNRTDQDSSRTGTYSPLNYVNSASQVVDSLVNDYLTKSRVQSRSNSNSNQQFGIQEDFSCKYDESKFYPGI